MRNNPRMVVLKLMDREGENKGLFGFKKYGAKIGKTIDQHKLSTKKVKYTEARENLVLTFTGNTPIDFCFIMHF